MRILIALIVFIAPFPAFAVESGGDFLKCSKDMIRLVEDEESMSYGRTIEAGYCTGVFHTLMWSVPKIPSLSFICIPESASAEQLARVYILYAENNPSILHKKAMTVLLASLTDAFPCEAM